MIDKQLYSLLGKDKKRIAFLTILSIVNMIANIVVTATICFVFSLVSQKNQSIIHFSTAVAVIILMLGLKAIIARLQTANKLKLGYTIKNDLRKKIYLKMTDLGGGFDKSESTAGLTQIAIEGIEQLDLYYTMYLPQLFYAMISPIILFCLCVVIDYRTAIVLLFCVPIIPITIILVSKYAKKIFHKYWNQYLSIGDKFLDNLQGIQELKIFNADETAQNKLDACSEKFRKVTMKVLIMQLMSITVMDIVAFGGAGLGIAMAVMAGVNNGLFPLLALFLILISAEFFLPMRALGSSFHIAMNGASAGKKIIRLLEMKETEWGTQDCSGGDLLLNCVSYGYVEGNNILNNVTMQFKKNMAYAIVGNSGCGKSTIVSLIIGKIAPLTGGVLINGSDIKSYSRQSYYSNIALVSYNTFIFGMSMRDNFLMAKKSATETEIYDMLTKVNLKEFVLNSGGLDAVINESATNISGGERQRLALAINLLSDKAIYIFDEATSNIDTESELIIMENIHKLSRLKTVILISHRLANVARADKIFVLKNGHIAEEGNHKELMQNQGQYSYLYHAQLKLENGYKEAKNA